jgi:DNA-directed RNA polymerase subunit RPC12/RpoP
MPEVSPTKGCPSCGSLFLVRQGFWNGATPASDRAAMAYQTTHPAYGWMLALRAASWAVKGLLATVYKCGRCGHVFRVWITD